MDSEVTPGTLLESEPPRRGFSLLELLLTAVLAVHAVAFALLYFRRGRRGFDLLFVAGFVLLAAFYAISGSLLLAGVEPEARHLSLLRSAGLILCGLATPPFLVHWYRRRRGEAVRA
jgi:hypothetical protein